MQAPLQAWQQKGAQSPGCSRAPSTAASYWASRQSLALWPMHDFYCSASTGRDCKEGREQCRRGKTRHATLAPFLLQGGIPADWGSPGSFPVLQRANLGGNQLRGTLPEMQNGAMCALEVRMHLPLLAPLMRGVLRHTLLLPCQWSSLGQGNASTCAQQLRTLCR